MADFKEELKRYVISEDTRKRPTPEQLQALEEAVMQLRDGSSTPSTRARQSSTPNG